MLARLAGLRRRIARRAHERRLAGNKLLRAFADAYPEATFVEIGANDGAQADHLRRLLARRDWRGVLVEPNPAAFARLRERHGANPRIALENAAISSSDGRLPFYELAPPGEGEPPELAGTYDLLGSLSRDALLALPFIRNPESRIARTEVDALTLDSLLRKHDLERVDLLVVDTEGHDYEIVRQVDLERDRPRLIVYEHCLLAEADRRACRERLAGAGYELLEEFFDTFALDTRILDKLTRRLRRLTPAVDAVSLREG